MFDSGITASDLIGQIKNEADIALPIPEESYITILNALEQLLYTEVIKEQSLIMLGHINDTVIDFGTINTTGVLPSDENAIRFEDIHAIYAGSTQLIESTVASGVIFPNTYYKVGNNIGLNLSDGQANDISIVYFVKPKLKTIENFAETNVMLPIEFIELAKSKLRGEAYKLVNEGELSAVWLNDYNILLEIFKAWVMEKQSSFGL